MIRTVSYGSQSFGPCLQAHRSPSAHIVATLGKHVEYSTPSSHQYEGSDEDPVNGETGHQESARSRIERLSRERPSVFRSI